jgi:hypothetical protein
MVLPKTVRPAPAVTGNGPHEIVGTGERTTDKSFRLDHLKTQRQPINAELVGSDAATAAGITVRGHAPILLLCRKLIEAGHDPNTALHPYRDETLCLTISSISAGARLEVNARGSGFISRRAVRTGPPVAPMAMCLVQPHKQAVHAAARRTPSS